LKLRRTSGRDDEERGEGRIERKWVEERREDLMKRRGRDGYEDEDVIVMVFNMVFAFASSLYLVWKFRSGRLLLGESGFFASQNYVNFFLKGFVNCDCLDLQRITGLLCR